MWWGQHPPSMARACFLAAPRASCSSAPPSPASSKQPPACMPWPSQARTTTHRAARMSRWPMGGTGASTQAAARTNLGLVIGTDIEAHDTDLTTIAGLTPTNDDILQRRGCLGQSHPGPSEDRPGLQPRRALRRGDYPGGTGSRPLPRRHTVAQSDGIRARSARLRGVTEPTLPRRSRPLSPRSRSMAGHSSCHRELNLTTTQTATTNRRLVGADRQHHAGRLQAAHAEIVWTGGAAAMFTRPCKPPATMARPLHASAMPTSSWRRRGPGRGQGGALRGIGRCRDWPEVYQEAGRAGRPTCPRGAARRRGPGRVACWRLLIPRGGGVEQVSSGLSPPACGGRRGRRRERRPRPDGVAVARARSPHAHRRAAVRVELSRTATSIARPRHLPRREGPPSHIARCVRHRSVPRAAPSTASSATRAGVWLRPLSRDRDGSARHRRLAPPSAGKAAPSTRARAAPRPGAASAPRASRPTPSRPTPRCARSSAAGRGAPELLAMRASAPGSAGTADSLELLPAARSAVWHAGRAKRNMPFRSYGGSGSPTAALRRLALAGLILVAAPAPAAAVGILHQATAGRSATPPSSGLRSGCRCPAAPPARPTAGLPAASTGSTT